ncbi:Ig-like domain-containing protein [Desulfovibrio sp. Huiquan2017]|uniref:tandem-95 repeat protein n=1 Tax=Desulfovibrio sp. Huiquan2017 TaxID=2816861 RepID=UPI001A919FC0|nr:Ig-like domain-containing protein [Desulfovibrio sp. Huiquan2017]
MADPKQLHISLPGAGKTQAYPLSAETPVHFDFDLSEATFTGNNGNLEIAIEGGGTVVLEGYQALADAGDLPPFEMTNGEVVAGDVYLFAFADQEATAEDLETAAGNATGSSGAGAYNDDAGTLFAGVDALGGQGDAFGGEAIAPLDEVNVGNNDPNAVDDVNSLIESAGTHIGGPLDSEHMEGDTWTSPGDQDGDTIPDFTVKAGTASIDQEGNITFLSSAPPTDIPAGEGGQENRAPTVQANGDGDLTDSSNEGDGLGITGGINDSEIDTVDQSNSGSEAVLVSFDDPMDSVTISLSALYSAESGKDGTVDELALLVAYDSDHNVIGTVTVNGTDSGRAYITLDFDTDIAEVLLMPLDNGTTGNQWTNSDFLIDGVTGTIAQTAAMVSGNVITGNASDQFAGADSDIDGDPLTVVSVSYGGAPAAGGGSYEGDAYDFVLTGEFGTLYLNADGSYVYVENTDATDPLNVEDSVNDVFDYTISDGAGGTASATLTVTVTGSNDAPTAVADTASLVENGILSGPDVEAVLSATGNVLQNDTDVDNFALGNEGDLAGTETTTEVYVDTIAAGYMSGDVFVATQVEEVYNADGDGDATNDSVIIEGQYGTLTIHADGTYSYALNNDNPEVNGLNADETLTETFQYTATNTVDDGQYSNATTLSITINGTNDAPTLEIQGRSAHFVEDGAYGVGTGAVHILAGKDIDIFDVDTPASELTVTMSAGQTWFMGDILGVSGENISVAPDQGEYGQNPFVTVYRYDCGGGDYIQIVVNNLTGSATLTGVENGDGTDHINFADFETALQSITYDIVDWDNTPITSDRTFTIEVSDNEGPGTVYTDGDDTYTTDTGSSQPTTVTVHVVASNDQVEANDDSYLVIEDRFNGHANTQNWFEHTGVWHSLNAIHGNVIANDTDPDADNWGPWDNNANDLHDLRVINGECTTEGHEAGADPNPYDGVFIIQGEYGTLYLRPDGSFLYEADQNKIDALGEGETAVESFSYTVADGSAGTFHDGNPFNNATWDEATLSIKLIGTNDAPTLEIVGPEATFVEEGIDANGYAIGGDAVHFINNVDLDDVDTDASQLTITVEASGGWHPGDYLSSSATEVSPNVYRYDCGYGDYIKIVVDGDTVTLTGVDNGWSDHITMDKFEAALETLTFGVDNANDNPDTSDRTFTVTVNDNNGSHSVFSTDGTASDTVTVHVQQSNDAPHATDNTNSLTEASGQTSFETLLEVEGDTTSHFINNGNQWDGDHFTVTAGTATLTGETVSFSGGGTLTDASSVAPGLGVTGGINGNETDTVDQDNSGTEAMRIFFDEPMDSVTITLSAFFDNGGEQETARLGIYDAAGNFLGSVAASGTSNGYYTVTLNASDYDSPIGSVVVMPTDNNTQGDQYSNSDFLLYSVSGTTATQVGSEVAGNVITDDSGYGIDSDPDNGDTALLQVTHIANGHEETPTNDIALSATDDGTNATTAIIEGLYGTLTIHSDGSYTYEEDPDKTNALSGDPNSENHKGEDVFTYTVADGHGGTDTATLTINITGTNDAPVANNDLFTEYTVTTEATSLYVDHSAFNDGNGWSANGVTLTASSDGSNPTLVNGSDPDDGIGIRSGSDASGSTEAAQIDGNDDETLTISFDLPQHTATVNLNWYDADDTPQFVVKDGDTVLATLTSVATPTGGGQYSYSYSIETANGGSVTGLVGNVEYDFPDGWTIKVAYDPNASYQTAHPYTFTVTAPDGVNVIDSIDVTASFNEGYHLADFVLDSVHAETVETTTTYPYQEDGGDIILNASDILGNDTDPDGDALHIEQILSATGGTVEWYDAGHTQLVFHPDADFNGTATFTYTASDGTAESNVATVSIEIQPVNDAPVAVDDTATTDEDSLLTVSADSHADWNLLSNDSDVDGDELSVTSFKVDGDNTTYNAGSTATLYHDGTEVGTLTINSDGTYTFDPADNFNGNVPTVTYTVSDGSLTDTADLNITVNPVNDAPTLDLAGGGGQVHLGNVDATYENVIGVYHVVNGVPTEPEIIWINDGNYSNTDPLYTTPEAVTDTEANWGFFIISDGKGYAENAELGFEQNADGSWALTVDGEPVDIQFDYAGFNPAGEEPSFRVTYDSSTNSYTWISGADDQLNTSGDDDDFDDPALSVDGASSGLDYADTYTENEAPISITGNVDIDDVDNGAMISKATITYEHGEDSLTQDGGLNFEALLALGFSVSGETNNPDGTHTVTITYSGGNASLEEFQAALHSITFGDTGEDDTVDAVHQFDIQVFDEHGAASNVATSTITVIAEDAPTLTVDEGSHIVYESALSDGSGDPAGASASTTGTLTVDGDVDNIHEVTVTLGSGTPVSLGGLNTIGGHTVELDLDGDGDNDATLTMGNYDSTTGEIGYTLELNSDVANTNDGNLEFDLNFDLRDSGQNSLASDGTTISVADDSPAATDFEVAIEEGTATSSVTNIQIILDTSQSMTNWGGVEGNSASRLDLAIQSIKDLAHAYDENGGFNIQIVTFNQNVAHSDIFNTQAALDSYLDNDISTAIWTRYDQGIAEAKSAWTEYVDANSDVISANSVAYFISDGEPQYESYDDPKLNSAEQAAWEEYVNDHFNTAYAIGIGSNAPSDADLLSVAHTPDGDDQIFTVTNLKELTDTLVGTVSENTVGNTLQNTETGYLLGADDAGAHDLVSLSYVIGGTTYTVDFTDATTEHTIELEHGAKLVIDGSGEYTYTAGTVDSDYSVVFTYTVQDGDGSTAEGQVTFTTLNVDELVAVHDGYHEIGIVSEDLTPQTTAHFGNLNNYDSPQEFVGNGVTISTESGYLVAINGDLGVKDGSNDLLSINNRDSIKIDVDSATDAEQMTIKFAWGHDTPNNDYASFDDNDYAGITIHYTNGTTQDVDVYQGTLDDDHSITLGNGTANIDYVTVSAPGSDDDFAIQQIKITGSSQTIDLGSGDTDNDGTIDGNVFDNDHLIAGQDADVTHVTTLDADGNTVYGTLDNGVISIDGQYGHLEIDAETGEYDYRPYEGQDIDHSVTDTFEYTISDGSGTSSASLEFSLHDTAEVHYDGTSLIDTTTGDDIIFPVDGSTVDVSAGADTIVIDHAHLGDAGSMTITGFQMNETDFNLGDHFQLGDLTGSSVTFTASGDGSDLTMLFSDIETTDTMSVTLSGVINDSATIDHSPVEITNSDDLNQLINQIIASGNTDS